MAQAALVAWLALELLLRSGDAAKSWEPSSEDRNTTRLIIGAYVALAVLSIVVPRATVGTVAWISIAVAAAGLALRIWAMRHLGRFYSRTLRVEGDQRVVDDGPYAYVRHPGYLSSMMVWVGSRAAINVLLAVPTAVVLGWVYLRRITAEEAMLTSTLGEPYETYTGHTKRLSPFVW